MTEEPFCFFQSRKALFTSLTDEWETPKDLFDRLDDVFKFNLDVCARAENAKCLHYLSREIDGLSKKWTGTCWMNPPYGKTIGEWVRKAYESARDNGATVVCLLPARTDTRWWHDWAAKGEVFFVKGRLKFGNSKNSAPFPSAIVVFRPQLKEIFNG